MVPESYDDYLRLLKLPRSAAELDIRRVITHEFRVWTRRANAPTLEARQEAERRVRTLEAAEQALLGPEGQVIRNGLRSDRADKPQIETSVDAENVARAIERVASARGTKAQERRGTVLYRRASIFCEGVDYVFEEVVHKKYGTAQDRKRCSASRGGLVLFDWSCATGVSQEPGKAASYIRGPWVIDLIAFAADCRETAT